jgi:predicted GIY-YIG superfamily endonuclease
MGRKKKERIAYTLLTCNKCLQTKPVDSFHVCRGRTTGRQGNCKICTNKITQAYRDSTNNAYWRHQADKPYYVYTITSPDNRVYCGHTGSRPNVRWGKHKADYKHKKVTLVLLYESFDKFGIQNHTFQVVDQAPTKEKAQLRESELILRYKETNNSLNVFMSAFRIGMYNRETRELIKVYNSIREAAQDLSKSKILKKGGLFFYHTYIRSAVMKSNRTGNTLGYHFKVLPFENGFFYDPKKK